MMARSIPAFESNAVIEKNNNRTMMIAAKVQKRIDFLFINKSPKF
jgi:hypothetical protein